MHVASIPGMTLEQQEFLLQNPSSYVILSTSSTTDGKRPLAPAPTSNSEYRCKKKVQQLGIPVQSASVARRNARERNRVKQVNNGFAALRSHIPSNILSSATSQGATGRGVNKKLSKVETLRLAVQYIKSLQQLLQEGGEDVSQQFLASERDPSDYDRDYGSSPSYSSHSLNMHTPPSSEASSPTPSQSSNYSVNNLYVSENYENYRPQSPEDDDELLDAIFSWQDHE